VDILKNYKFDDFYDEKLERKGFCYLPWKYTTVDRFIEFWKDRLKM
jgi:hypothetical protein